jgi:hypothetical protein
MNLWFIHCVISVLLMGLIWVIQVVHYPFFRFIDVKNANAACQFHQWAISVLVMPLMSLELISGLYLAYSYWDEFLVIHLVNLSTIFVLWIYTLFVMVPIHMKLTTSFDVSTIKLLVKRNWVRSFLWTAKAGFWCYFINAVLT